MVVVEGSSALRGAVELLIPTVMLVVLERESSKLLGRLVDQEDEEETFLWPEQRHLLDSLLDVSTDMVSGRFLIKSMRVFA